MQLPLLLLTAILLAPSPARSAPEARDELDLSYTTYLDLADIPGSIFRSRVRIVFHERLHAPAKIETSTSESTDDLGNTHVETDETVSGAPLAEEQVDIDEVDPSGTVLRTLAHSTHERASIVALPAASYPFYPAPLLHLSPSVGPDPATIRDASGKQAYVTIDAVMQPVIYLDPASRRYVLLDQGAIELSATFAYVPDGMNYSPGPTFNTHDQAVPTTLAVAAECTRAGEMREVSPMVVGPDLAVKRVELCRAEGTGVARSVLIRANPAHETATALKLTYSAALSRGGAEAKAPLFALPKEKTTYANCHGYALLATLGASALPADAWWVQGVEPAQYTLGTLPLPPILSANFREVLSVASAYYDVDAETRLAKDARLKEGDFITFWGNGGFAHSGVVRKHAADGTWWVESKFEEGPVIDTPITSVHDVIPNLYAKIRVFRKK